MLVAWCGLVSKLLDLIRYIYMVMSGPGQTILLHGVPIQVLQTLQLTGLLSALRWFILHVQGRNLASFFLQEHIVIGPLVNVAQSLCAPASSRLMLLQHFLDRLR